VALLAIDITEKPWIHPSTMFLLRMVTVDKLSEHTIVPEIGRKDRQLFLKTVPRFMLCNTSITDLEQTWL
jgi:hypothetical protein